MEAFFMIQSIVTALVAAISGMVGTQNHFDFSFDTTQQGPLPPPTTPVKYTCKKPTWPEKPRMSDGRLYATIQATCEFDTIAGTGYVTLEKYLHEKIQREAFKINKGPISEVYENLDSHFYDVTVKAVGKKSSNTTTIRSDSHIATNFEDKLLFATLSTKIDGEGTSGYLKRLNIKSYVVSTPSALRYEITLTSHFELDKPWFIPGSTFKSEVKSRLEEEIPKQEGAIIQEIALHL
jgi:hypothetical protein